MKLSNDKSTRKQKPACRQGVNIQVSNPFLGICLWKTLAHDQDEILLSNKCILSESLKVFITIWLLVSGVEATQ